MATLKKLIPEGSVVHSFLFFDGNIEVELSNANRFVVAHTNNYVNYEFWRCLVADPERVSVIARHFSPIESENIFDILQKEWPQYPDPFMRSAMFYLLNRSSDMAYVSCGKLLEDIDLTHSINKMKTFSSPNLHLELDKDEDFLTSASTIKTDCDYVFMPIGPISLNLLEEGKSEGFEQTKIIHQDVKSFLENTDKKAVLLYKYSPMVLEFFENHNQLIIDQWGRHTDVTKFAKEVLIANF